MVMILIDHHLIEISIVKIIIIVIITSTTTTSSSPLPTTNNTSPPPCQFYLSISTLSTPQHPQLGIFSTISIPRNTTLPTPPSLSLPLIDYDPQQNSLLSSHLWTPERTLSQFLGRSVLTILPGLPSITPIPERNRFATVDLSSPPSSSSSLRIETLRDDAGAGSRTEIHNVELVTMKRLRAGQEIFLDMGVDYDDEEEEEGATEEERRRAAVVARHFQSWREGYDPSPEERDVAWDLVRRTVVRSEAVRELLPLKGEDVFYHEEGLVMVSRLIEEGVCYDQWEAKESPGVGWGAFMTRAARES